MNLSDDDLSIAPTIEEVLNKKENNATMSNTLISSTTGYFIPSSVTYPITAYTVSESGFYYRPYQTPTYYPPTPNQYDAFAQERIEALKRQVAELEQKLQEEKTTKPVEDVEKKRVIRFED